MVHSLSTLSRAPSSTHLLKAQTATIIDVAPVGLVGDKFTIVSTHHMVNGLVPFSVGIRYGGFLNLAYSFCLGREAAHAS